MSQEPQTDERFPVQDYTERLDELESWPVRISSYKLKDVYVCKIDNVSPGATIARVETTESAEAAEAEAIAKATRRLAKTERRAD